MLQPPIYRLADRQIGPAGRIGLGSNASDQAVSLSDGFTMRPKEPLPALARIGAAVVDHIA
jgi:hypothetical protein